MQINFARTVTTGAGFFGRIQIFPVRRTSKRRGAKRKPTSAIQARLNQKNAEKNLADQLHMNFTPDDDEVSLDYHNDTMPKDYPDAVRIIRNFLRRYKPVWSRETGRPVSEFKYIIVTECSKRGRFHHHCAFTGGVDQRIITKIWKMGRSTTDALKFNENGLRGLSHYTTKQRLGYRRWMGSKNLKKPAPRSSDYRLTVKEMRYINEHPEDVGFIENRFPGWKVSPRGIMCQRIRTEIKEAEGAEAGAFDGMPFVEIEVYRDGCPYWTYDREGHLQYIFGKFGREFKIPSFGFGEAGA